MTLYLRRTAGSAMAGNGPGDLGHHHPDHGEQRAYTVPTARGITSHDGGLLDPPNHTKAKNPSTATVTPRLARPEMT